MLGGDDILYNLLPDGLYTDWQSEELNLHCIAIVTAADPDLPNNTTPDYRAEEEGGLNNLKLSGKNHYITIMRRATSLKWIFNLIKQEYNINTECINFPTLDKILYKSETMTPVHYYCQIYHIVPSRIILVTCTYALLYTIYVWLPMR